MRILVTGASGFVGSRLVKALKGLKHEVVAFDRHHGFDLLKEEDIKQALKGCQAVIHLAAALDESLSESQLMKVNFEGTRFLLEEASRQKIKKFFFLSSVGVMGDISGRVDETAPRKPKTGYEKSKAAAEKLVLEFKNVFSVVVLRSALVYGPNTYWRGIVKLVRKGFPVIGSGENMFQLVHVNDLVSAITFLLPAKKGGGEIFIVAEDNPKTLNQVYAAIQQELGTTKPIKHMPLFLGKLLALFMAFKKSLLGGKTLLLPEYIERLVRVRHYNTAKLKELGWKPQYTLEKGLKETVQALKKEGW
jgi:nucleoside-diphosphate-sugar epimerase